MTYLTFLICKKWFGSQKVNSLQFLQTVDYKTIILPQCYIF